MGGNAQGGAKLRGNNRGTLFSRLYKHTFVHGTSPLVMCTTDCPLKPTQVSDGMACCTKCMDGGGLPPCIL